MLDERLIPVTIEDEMKSSFIDYAMSVIVSRALPDVRDGLKPVHRRILYAMHGLKNYHNKPYLKSARIVGDVIGKYHPHGDSPVYEALVRLAQNFSMRYPLIDGQGNFGSVDGDSAAAMRYTESRMAQIAEFLLEDIEQDTVDFVPNYDNKDIEPVVLPAKYPQILVNGSSGIAVGMATNIPPHNMHEVLSGLEAYIHDPQISLRGLVGIIKGPDFPTAGEIHGVRGIYEAYERGRGSITVRAKAYVEHLDKQGRDRIIVTEIPYQVNKAKLIEKIAELVSHKKIEGISDIRDESAKEEIRIVIEVKKGEQPEVLLNNLYKFTQMQISFGFNLVALLRGKPKLLSLKEILAEFYVHRKEIILRRTTFQLKKAEERAHILLGLKVAVENADEIVALIRSAKDSPFAQSELIRVYGLSEIQAKAILDMRLARLTALEREKIVREHEEIISEIANLLSILRSSEKVKAIILEEIRELKEKLSDTRKTAIFADEADEFSMESLVPDEDVVVTITYSGYVKRTPLVDISSQRRGGKGRSGMITKEEDFLQNIFTTRNHHSLLCFTDRGRVYNLKVYSLPEAQLRSRGRHFANLISLEESERIVSVLPLEKFVEDQFIVSVTERGLVKKTDLMAYSSVRSNGIIGLKLDEGDRLVSCLLSRKGDDILLATKLGKAIRFSEEDIRATGRVSMGVTGVRFSEEEDRLIGADIITQTADSSILSVCENGFGKRTELSEYRKQNRGGIGIYTIKVSERNGPVMGILQVHDKDEVVIMTSSGKLSRIKLEEVRVVGRVAQGVKLMSVDEGEKIIAISKVSLENGLDEE